ncbi:MAG: ABC transporter permease [Nitrospirae bacterium]|nr:ABC transporter permease [Nitrospirota bacterium]
MLKGLFNIFKNRYLTLLSAVIIALLILSAISAPLISPFSYDAQDTANILKTPDSKHIMGTDKLGRDIFSRILYGSQISLSVGIIATLIAMIIGVLYGAISGYKGGRLDNYMMRIVDIIYALPDILVIILITIIIGRGFLGIVLAISIVNWVGIARLMRGEVLKLKEQLFVESAKAIGAGHWRIILRHILPNALGPLIVTMTFRIPAAILSESTLSFIGLGLAPPFSSWGVLANDGWTALRFYPHLLIFPAIMIFITVLSFNIIGDALKDAIDPELRTGGA